MPNQKPLSAATSSKKQESVDEEEEEEEAEPKKVVGVKWKEGGGEKAEVQEL